MTFETSCELSSAHPKAGVWSGTAKSHLLFNRRFRFCSPCKSCTASQATTMHCTVWMFIEKPPLTNSILFLRLKFLSFRAITRSAGWATRHTALIFLRESLIVSKEPRMSTLTSCLSMLYSNYWILLHCTGNFWALIQKIPFKKASPNFLYSSTLSLLAIFFGMFY